MIWVSLGLLLIGGLWYATAAGVWCRFGLHQWIVRYAIDMYTQKESRCRICRHCDRFEVEEADPETGKKMWVVRE